MGVLRELLKHWPRRIFAPAAHLRAKYEDFKGLLDADEKSQVLIAELEEVLYAGRAVDPARVPWLCRRLGATVQAMAQRLAAMHPTRYQRLEEVLRGIDAEVEARLAPPAQQSAPPYLLTLDQCLGKPELAGGKAANLAAAARAGLNVPPALAVSARAFTLLVEANGLRPRLDRMLRQMDLERPDKLAAQCTGLRELVLSARLPGVLAEALQEAAARPELAGGPVAVRSSAVGEDGRLSFAGQYASELNVPPRDLPAAWQRIVAAKYRPRAVAYRIRNGLWDAETPMAVLLMPMIPARCAGALFSRESGHGAGGEPRQTGEESVTIFALPGLGDCLMSGQAAPRVLRLRRGLPPAPLDDTGPRDVGLDQDALSGLVRTALALEDHFCAPQEVEWALDHANRLFVLQSRPHRVHDADDAPGAGDAALSLAPAPDRAPLAANLPRVACGVACGPVFHLRAAADAFTVPKGSVVAVESLSPSLGRCVGRAVAVLAETGSRASHFASIAREFRLPVLTGDPALLRGLADGLMVTVDANAGALYEGRVESLLAGHLAASEAPDAAGLPDQAMQTAGRRFPGLAPLVCALSLTDPDSPDFAPQGCRSLHDVVRFCHEKAVAEMFSLADRSGRGMHAARRLESPLPLSMYVLDLGGGLEDGGEDARSVRPGDFASVPMRAFWLGLAHAAETWDGAGLHCDWEEFDRISAGIFRKDAKLLASYALFSADYLHLLVRFGYHFAVLDSLCAERADGNYIGLRFKGGGGLEEQKLHRLVFLRRVLAGAGFTVRTRGDMLDARYARASQEATCLRLTLLGRLLARTRLMDMRLSDAGQALRQADDFLAEVHCGR
ncbi:MAG: PEP/pyruvate-binding domain-containing protein [Desulfovibrio sp.]